MILISTFKFFAILSTKEKHPESSSSQNARNIKSLIHTLYVCDSLNGEYNSKKEVHFFRKSVKLVHLVYAFVFDLNISANHTSHQFSKGSIGIQSNCLNVIRCIGKSKVFFCEQPLLTSIPIQLTGV